MKKNVLLCILALLALLFGCNNKNNSPEVELQGDEWVVPNNNYVKIESVHDSLVVDCLYVNDSMVTSHDWEIIDTGYVRYHNPNDSCGVAVKGEYLRTLLFNNSSVVRDSDFYGKRCRERTGVDDRITWEIKGPDAEIEKLRLSMVDDYGLFRSEVLYKDSWYESEYSDPELKDFLRETGLSEETISIVGDFVTIGFPVANQYGQLDHIGYNHTTYRVWDVISLYSQYPIKKGIRDEYRTLFTNNEAAGTKKLEIEYVYDRIQRISFKEFTIKSPEDVGKILSVLLKLFPEALEVPVLESPEKE